MTIYIFYQLFDGKKWPSRLKQSNSVGFLFSIPNSTHENTIFLCFNLFLNADCILVTQWWWRRSIVLWMETFECAIGAFHKIEFERMIFFGSKMILIQIWIHNTSSFINTKTEGYHNFVTFFSSPMTDLTNFATFFRTL